MNRKLILLLFSLIIIIGSYYANDLRATTGDTTPIFFECVGVGCPITENFVALLNDPDNFQAWQARIYASIQGHSVDARFGIDMCLSSNGAMYNSGEPCWTIIDENTDGLIGNSHLDGSETRSIGNDPLPDLSYAVVELYAKDVTFEYPGSNVSTMLIVKGRQVSMAGPTPSKTSVIVGQTFTVDWSTSETTDGPSDVVFSYTGPVSCDLASPTGQFGNTDSSATCTATGVGTATFTVSATGYNGKVGPRPKTISNSTNVTINNSNTLTMYGAYLDPPVVEANGVNTYEIVVAGSDGIDGSNIEKQYALINYQGSDAGSYRGYLSWGKSDYWPTDKNHIKCDGDGWAVVRDISSPGFGDQYINLVYCNSSIRTPDIRKTKFYVTFNPIFTADGPFTGNDISVNMMDSGGETTGWINNTDLFDVIAPGTVLASIYANVNGDDDVTNVSVNPGDSIVYNWLSYNATGGSTNLIIYDINTGNPVSSDGCSPPNNSGPFSGISGTTGSISNSILACQQGYGYQYTYTATDGAQTAESVLSISVAYSDSVPVLDTPTDTSVSTTEATLGANLVSLGVPATVIERGTCWGTSPNPTINCLSEGGVSIGAFSHLISGLAPDTFYYFRGYAINDTGTGYSEDGTFITTTSPVDGICGSRAGGPTLTTRTYPTNDTDWTVGDTYCSVGNPSSSPAFPAVSSSVTWQCLGTGGGFSPLCTANHDDQFSISVTINTTVGGTVISMPAGISCGGTCYNSFTQNSLVTLIPIPNSAYWKFNGWTLVAGGSSDSCSGTGVCILTIDGTKEVTASFVPRGFKYSEF